MTLDVLMKYGRALVDEQENVKRVQLAEEYLSGEAEGGAGRGRTAGRWVGAGHGCRHTRWAATRPKAPRAHPPATHLRPAALPGAQAPRWRA
jgi:hypothetical protein